MLVFSPKKIIHSVILLLLALTPIFGIGEVQRLMSNSSAEIILGPMETPVFIKLIKDFGFASIIFLSFLIITSRRKVTRHVFYFVPFSLFILVLVVQSFVNQPLSALLGIRWILPLFLVFFLINNVNEILIKKIATLLSFLFILFFILQVYQLFNISLYGKTYFGLAARTPGFFLFPNTAGFFACLVFFFVYFYMNTCRLKKVVLFLVPFSVFFTVSGAAIIVFLLVCFVLVFLKRNFKLAIFIVYLIPLVTIILLGNPATRGELSESINMLGILLGRDHSFSYSLTQRTDILHDLYDSGKWISSDFGAATNAGYLMNVLNARVVDSTYASIVGNIGIIGFFAFVFIFVIWLYGIVRTKRMDILIFTIIYSLFGFSTIITESFPANLLFSVGMAYFIPIVWYALMHKHPKHNLIPLHKPLTNF